MISMTILNYDTVLIFECGRSCVWSPVGSNQRL